LVWGETTDFWFTANTLKAGTDYMVPVTGFWSAVDSFERQNPGSPVFVPCPPVPSFVSCFFSKYQYMLNKLFGRGRKKEDRAPDSEIPWRLRWLQGKSSNLFFFKKQITTMIS